MVSRRVRVRATLGGVRFDLQRAAVRSAGLRFSPADDRWHGVVASDLSADLVTWQHLQQAAYEGAHVEVVVPSGSAAPAARRTVDAAAAGQGAVAVSQSEG